MASDQMRYMHSLGEVAPSLIQFTHQKSSSRSRLPKLETILEEGTENRMIQFPLQGNKGALLVAFPVVMSIVSYYFLL